MPLTFLCAQESEIVRAGSLAADSLMAVPKTGSLPVSALPHSTDAAPGSPPPLERTSLKLSPRKNNTNTSTPLKSPNTMESLATVGGSLALVLGIFFLTAFFAKKSLVGKVAKLPNEAIEVLGKSPIARGQELQLVRIGNRLLLLNVTQHATETLTEISSPEEVEHLAAMCRRNGPQSSSAGFDQMLLHMGREPAQGFAESPRARSFSGGTPRA